MATRLHAAPEALVVWTRAIAELKRNEHILAIGRFSDPPVLAGSESPDARSAGHRRPPVLPSWIVRSEADRRRDGQDRRAGRGPRRRRRAARLSPGGARPSARISGPGARRPASPGRQPPGAAYRRRIARAGRPLAVLVAAAGRWRVAAPVSSGRRSDRRVPVLVEGGVRQRQARDQRDPRRDLHASTGARPSIGAGGEQATARDALFQCQPGTDDGAAGSSRRPVGTSAISTAPSSTSLAAFSAPWPASQSSGGWRGRCRFWSGSCGLDSRADRLRLASADRPGGGSCTGPGDIVLPRDSVARGVPWVASADNHVPSPCRRPGHALVPGTIPQVVQ